MHLPSSRVSTTFSLFRLEFENRMLNFCFSYTGYNETPTSQTVDSYMAHLRSIIQENAPENADIIAAARDIISRLNYSA